MTTFLITILVVVVVLVLAGGTWLIWLRLTRLTVQLICESIHNLSQAYFANRQMSQDLDHNRLKNRLQIKAAARAARAAMWANSDIEIEVLKSEN